MRKKETKKTSTKKNKKHLHKFTYFTIALDLLVVIALIVIYSPIFKFDQLWIPTAMTTMEHKYLAYKLYSEKLVTKVMSYNYIETINEKVNLNDIVIGGNKNKNYPNPTAQKEKYFKFNLVHIFPDFWMLSVVNKYKEKK